MADLNKPYKITEKVNGILEKKISIVEPKFVQQVTEWITKFQTSSGNIVRTKSNRDRMASFKTAMERYLERAGYYDMISQYLTGFDAMAEAQKEIQQDLNAISLTQSFLNQFKRVAIKQVVDNMTKQGLMNALINPIRNELNIAVNQGSSLTDVVTSIRGQLSTNEKRQGILKKLSLQSTRDALGQYDGTVNEAVRKTYKLDALLYVGSLVKDSRPQCERWTQYEENGKRGLILFEQLEDEILWADNNGTGMIPNTTPENFCQNRGGYNCRHVAYPVRNPNKITKAGNVSEKVDPEISKAEQQEAIDLLKYSTATTVKQAKENTKLLFENFGYNNIEKISFSNDLTLEDLNERNKQLYNLLNNYNLDDKTEKITFENKSSNKLFGVVYLSINKLKKKVWISKANFGDKYDTKNRTMSLSDEKDLLKNMKFRGKSKVDDKNIKISTLTHEFAHFVTINYKAKYGNEKAKEFFKDLDDIRKEYKKELDEMLTMQDILDLKEGKDIGEKIDNYLKIFLGNYANTNLDEFLAEGFTEYKLKTNPSKYALKIGKLFDKFYKK